MRKDIKGCRIEVLCEALDKLGYEGTRLHTSYRKGPFHVKIREKRIICHQHSQRSRVPLHRSVQR